VVLNGENSKLRKQQRKQREIIEPQDSPKKSFLNLDQRLNVRWSEVQHNITAIGQEGINTMSCAPLWQYENNDPQFGPGVPYGNFRNASSVLVL
jgi:hypothetical protein